MSVEVYRSINTADDPLLAQRLRSSDPATALNLALCPNESAPRTIDVSVVYHDPGAPLFVLMLPESLRHREIQERASLLTALAAETSTPVPPYVVEFAVVYGPAGLDRLLESRAQAQRDRGRLDREADELRARTLQIDERAATVDSEAAALTKLRRSIEEREAALARRTEELQRQTEEFERRTRELSVAEAELRVERAKSRAQAKLQAREAAVPAPRDDEPELETDRFGLVDPVEIIADGSDAEIEVFHPAARERETPDLHGAGLDRDVDSALDRALPNEERTNPRYASGAVIEIEADPASDLDMMSGDLSEVTTQPTRSSQIAAGSTQVGGHHDVALERWVVSRGETLIRLDDSGAARFAACVNRDQIDSLAVDNLQLRFQLHRLPSYPLLTLAMGTTQSFVGEAGSAEPYCFHIDAGSDVERRVVEALAREFAFALELYDAEYTLVRRRNVSGVFAENARVALAAALVHLAGIPPQDRSFSRAVLAHSAPTYDRFARNHPARREFRDDWLQQLESPSDVARALGIARRFSAPDSEDYLLFLRGYPLSLWHARRRAVLARAIAMGLWVGPDLANIAVSENLALSRRDLALSLQRSFAHLVADSSAHDLPDALVHENWSALREALTGMGLDPGDALAPRTEPIASDRVAEASGTIAPVVRSGGNGERRQGQALIQLLEGKETRLAAALELAERAEAWALGPLFEAIRRMTRGEAGRALGASVKFGKPGVPFLLATLASRKGYLRQGAALALAVLKEEEGIEAICDLLVQEPTEIWREIARALGEAGPSAVMSLASRLADQPADVRERVAWALAHIAARGTRGPVETLARGRDAVAASVARRAMELVELAQSDDIAVRGPTSPRDQTVNRAFSRRFFEALERGGEGVPGERTGDVSGPAMPLDEADLLEAVDMDDGDEPDSLEALDESDLIPT